MEELGGDLDDDISGNADIAPAATLSQANYAPQDFHTSQHSQWVAQSGSVDHRTQFAQMSLENSFAQSKMQPQQSGGGGGSSIWGFEGKHNFPLDLVSFENFWERLFTCSQFLC